MRRRDTLLPGSLRTGIIFSSFVLFALLELSPLVKGAPSDSECQGIHCQDPPKDGKCIQVMENSDPKIHKPSGAKAKCCPLWKCSNGGDSKNFYTFHGLIGERKELSGSEIVRYEENQEGLSVVSKGKGNHDSVANTMSNDEMAEFQKAMSGMFA